MRVCVPVHVRVCVWLAVWQASRKAGRQGTYVPTAILGHGNTLTLVNISRMSRGGTVTGSDVTWPSGHPVTGSSARCGEISFLFTFPIKKRNSCARIV